MSTETEKRLRRSAVEVGRIIEHLEELATADNAALMGLFGGMWFQEARMELHVAVAKLTAAAEMVAGGQAAKKDEGPGLYVPR